LKGLMTPKRRLILVALALVEAGCNQILGFGDYSIGSADAATDGHAGHDSSSHESSTHDGPRDSGPRDSSVDGGREASCESDSANGACYSCAPKTTPDFLNACTNSGCVPFDDTRVTRLPPDGGLPPVPPIDAGTE